MSNAPWEVIGERQGLPSGPARMSPGLHDQHTGMKRAAFSFPAKGTRQGYQFTEISIAVNLKSHEGGLEGRSNDESELDAWQ